MKEFTVLADVNTDIDEAYAASEHIPILPQYYHFNDGVIYGDEQKMDSGDFYRRLEKEQAYSVGCNPERVRNIMEEELKAGRDCLCVMCSSKCSGSCSTVAMMAAELMDEYPDNRIYVVDTYLECSAAGILVYLAQEMKKKGCTIEEVRDELEEKKSRVDVYFLVDSLDYLIRGGRLNPISGMVGNLLDIKPILHFKEGEIVSLMKCRGKSKGKSTILKLLKEKKLDPDLIFVAYTANSREGQEFQELLERELPVKARFLNEVNPTIGTHTGPNAVAVAFCELP